MRQKVKLSWSMWTNKREGTQKSKNYGVEKPAFYSYVDYGECTDDVNVVYGLRNALPVPLQ